MYLPRVIYTTKLLGKNKLKNKRQISAEKSLYRIAKFHRLQLPKKVAMQHLYFTTKRGVCQGVFLDRRFPKKHIVYIVLVYCVSVCVLCMAPVQNSKKHMSSNIT